MEKAMAYGFKSLKRELRPPNNFVHRISGKWSLHPDDARPYQKSKMGKRKVSKPRLQKFTPLEKLRGVGDDFLCI